jgi:hypothetical protein
MRATGCPPGFQDLLPFTIMEALPPVPMVFHEAKYD